MVQAVHTQYLFQNFSTEEPHCNSDYLASQKLKVCKTPQIHQMYDQQKKIQNEEVGQRQSWREDQEELGSYRC